MKTETAIVLLVGVGLIAGAVVYIGKAQAASSSSGARRSSSSTSEDRGVIDDITVGDIIDTYNWIDEKDWLW